MSRSRLRFIIFFATAALILTVHLRSSNSVLFHQYRKEVVKQEKLKQKLWEIQLELEQLTQPYQIKQQIQQENP